MSDGIQVGHIVAVVAQGRVFYAQVGKINGRGQDDDHRGVIEANRKVSWVYPDAIYAPGEMYRGRILLTEQDAAEIRHQFDGLLSHKTVRANLFSPTTARIDSKGRPRYRRGHDLDPKPGRGAPESGQVPIRLHPFKSPDWTAEMAEYIEPRRRTLLYRGRLRRLRLEHPDWAAVWDLHEGGAMTLLQVGERLHLRLDQVKWRKRQAANFLARENGRVQRQSTAVA